MGWPEDWVKYGPDAWNPPSPPAIRANKPPAEKTYLGDSVYAEIDPYGALVLTTENGLPDDPSNRIVLEDEVFQAMLSYVHRHKGGA